MLSAVKVLIVLYSRGDKNALQIDTGLWRQGFVPYIIQEISHRILHSTAASYKSFSKSFIDLTLNMVSIREQSGPAKGGLSVQTHRVTFLNSRDVLPK